MPPSPLLTCERWSMVQLAADLAVVAPAVQALRQDLQSRKVPAQVRENVALAVTEAVTNAIRHGKSEPGFSDVHLCWKWTDDVLCVAVSEPGHFSPGSDWTELPDDPEAESGRGGFLIAQGFESVRHRNHAGRHVLEMTCEVPGAGAAVESSGEVESMLDAMTGDLSASYETLSALFKLAETLATAADLDAFVTHVLGLRELAEADEIHLRLVDESGRLGLRGSAGGRAGTIPESLDASGPAIEAEVFRSGVERTLDSGAALAAGDPLRAATGPLFVCPVHFQGRRLGVCALVRSGADYFTAGQLSVARTTIEFLGIACANAEHQAQRLSQLRVRRELEIAAQIQSSLIPRNFPKSGGWAVHGASASALEAGGDFFDVVPCDNGLFVVIADVMGKGMPAALLAVVLRTAVRANLRHAAAPARLLDQVSAQIAADLEMVEMFITAQAVFAEHGTGRVVYASAGHCPVAVLGSIASSDRILGDGGLPLGVDAKERYKAHEVTLASGERMILSTDGILESESGGQQLGLGGLLSLARRHRSPGLDHGTRQILADLAARDAGRPPTDDRTLVILEKLA